jgi:hypothetical protein
MFLHTGKWTRNNLNLGSSTFIMGKNTSDRIFAERAAGSEAAWICRAPFPLTPAAWLAYPRLDW